MEGRPILVVAAGEKWADGSLRPALEDGLGAGMLLSLLRLADLDLSGEARVIAAMYEATPDLAGAIGTCTSARELSVIGYEGDVESAEKPDLGPTVAIGRLGSRMRDPSTLKVSIRILGLSRRGCLDPGK